MGRKQVLHCEVENDLAEYCLLLERKFFGLAMVDVMHLAYHLAVRNGIKNQFCKRNVKTGRKWLKKFLNSHKEISVTTTAQFFFKSTNPLCTPFNIILQDVTTATKPASQMYNTNTREYRVTQKNGNF